jgi:hypothetical protein
MKKLIIVLILICLPVICSATTVLYRISSMEVTDISSTNNTFGGYVQSGEFAVLIDPPLSDGTECRQNNADYRVFGYAKINDSGTVRNATQAEIDTFAPAQIDDRNQRDAGRSLNHLKTDPNLRRIITAFAAIMVSEINILRSEHGLPDRTLSQLKTAIENRISKDD